MTITPSIRACSLGALCLVTLLVAGSLTACADEETSTCEVGGECETQQLNQCTCCPFDQQYSCETNVSEACGTGGLTVVGTAESCGEFNSKWQLLTASGGDPCQDVSADEVTDFCDQAVGLFD